MPLPTRILAALLLSTGLPSCGTEPPAAERRMPPPLAIADSAFSLAGETQLPERTPEERTGLHNVFRLSDTIISGSEPHGEAAFAELERMGVRTILSVDGKVPDADAARRHGIDYVHVPIQYKGISAGEILAIAKTFRELEGPFYVHCFHGKHRGPAAAAIGRIVLDDSPRETALAEMRQWCGTSESYEGLYASIANDPIPDVDATTGLAFDFPSAHAFEGVRGAMVAAPRAHDNLKALGERDWSVDPEHPDIDPVNEASILRDLFEQLSQMPETLAQPDDFRGWADDARVASRELHEALDAGRQAVGHGAPLALETIERAGAALKAVGGACKSCHIAYRDV